MSINSKKYHYIYKVTNILNNRYYIGMHSTNNLSDGYLGSGKILRHSIRKYGNDNHSKEILEYCDSREILSIKESKYITEDVVKDSLCMNIMLGGEGWNTSGQITVKDINNNNFNVFLNDPRYLSGELKAVWHGMTVVKDVNNNRFRVKINDPRYLSGELKSVNIGMVVVKDKSGKRYHIFKNDPRYLSGELVGITHGTKHSQKTKSKMSISGSGNKNSQYGKTWIYSLGEKISKRVDKKEIDQYLTMGWLKGRKMKF